MTPKEQRAYELRLSGKTFKEIARELKYADASGAYQAYQRAREVISLDNLSEWRLLELERLNTLQTALWEKAMEGSILTINALLRIFDLRAKLIGLYAPERHQISHEDTTPETFDQVLKDMTEMIELGEKYAREKSIQTNWMVRKEKKESDKWHPDAESSTE